MESRSIRLSVLYPRMGLQIPKEIEQAIDEMPTISPIVNKLASMAKDIEVAPKDLVQVIMIDPVLSAKVIRMVNSSFMGLQVRVQSLAQAVIILGVNTVKNMAMATAVLEKFLIKSQAAPIDSEIFWQHCLGVAVSSKLLARSQNIGQDDQEQYFLAGLLHDVGKVVYLKSVPHQYRVVLDESKKLGLSLEFAELAHFGCSHTHVGGLLARRWQLDPVFIEVIEGHHSKCHSDYKQIVQYITIANNLCKASKLGDGGDLVLEELAEDFAVEQGIDALVLKQVSETMPEELKKATQFLKVAKEKV
jgi:putative nucleotidyltransferase with HDIG domain